VRYALEGSPKRASRRGRQSALVLVPLVLALLSGCTGASSKTSVVRSTSVADLQKHLPNLGPLGIVSCNYTVVVTSKSDWVPSPSDTRLELRGSLTLSQAGAAELKSRYRWRPAGQGEVPARLLAILPPGGVLVSQELNEAFDQSPGYPHGFAAVAVRDGWSRMYFLAVDREHVIG